MPESFVRRIPPFFYGARSRKKNATSDSGGGGGGVVVYQHKQDKRMGRKMPTIFLFIGRGWGVVSRRGWDVVPARGWTIEGWLFFYAASGFVVVGVVGAVTLLLTGR